VQCGDVVQCWQRRRGPVAVGFGWGGPVVLMDNFIGGKDSKSFVINKLK
jgi:hypothetical protein